MEKLQNTDVIMLLCRVQLFLFGCVFTAGARIVKSQFSLHGRIERLKGHCQAINCPNRHEEKAEKD
jgi:hypothetical protein